MTIDKLLELVNKRDLVYYKNNRHVVKKNFESIIEIEDSRGDVFPVFNSHGKLLVDPNLFFTTPNFHKLSSEAVRVESSLHGILGRLIKEVSDLDIIDCEEAYINYVDYYGKPHLAKPLRVFGNVKSYIEIEGDSGIDTIESFDLLDLHSIQTMIYLIEKNEQLYGR